MLSAIGRTARAALIAALLWGGVGAAVARGDLVGKWYVTNSEDRFGDGATMLAMTESRSGDAMFAVRCIRRQWSLAVMVNRVKAGERFRVRLRVDRGDIVDTTGRAIADDLIQIETKSDMIWQIIDDRRREIALRVADTRGVGQDYVFGIGKARLALAGHFKECPLE